MCAFPIVVITPVKNESWILHHFLSVTSEFADFIIVADQFSTDDSRDIAAKFEKVILIKNDREEYDEQYRQSLLINKAREVVSGKKLLLALDADEIITADSIGSKDWKYIGTMAPATVLRFEKPDLLPGMKSCFRHTDFFTLGYIDDGATHYGKTIHSVRIPRMENSPSVDIESIKFMHLALARPHEYAARQRYYSVVENIEKISPFYRRLIKYSPRVNNYIAQLEKTNTPANWINGWKNKGVDLMGIKSLEENNFNDLVLHSLCKLGRSKFYFDDIWDIDWEQYYKRRNFSLTKNSGLNSPKSMKMLLNVIISCINKIR